MEMRLYQKEFLEGDRDSWREKELKSFSSQPEIYFTTMAFKKLHVRYSV
jgi:hypothetical protein